MRGKILRIWVLCALALLVFSGTSSAGFYKYKAGDGSIHFVDDVSKVPPQFRDQLQEYEEAVAPPPSPDAVSAPEDRPAAESAEAVPVMETSIVVMDSHVLVPVTLGDGRNEINVMMVMDTGAAKMVLNRDIARRIYLEPLGNATMIAADGRRVKTEAGMIANMEVGPFRLANVPAIIMPDDPQIGYSGLLGFEVLKNFKYTVDFQRQVIRWEPVPGIP